MWELKGQEDASRMSSPNLADHDVDEWMHAVFGPNQSTKLPDGLVALFEDPGKEAILESMSKCDHSGVVEVAKRPAAPRVSAQAGDTVAPCRRMDKQMPTGRLIVGADGR